MLLQAAASIYSLQLCLQSLQWSQSGMQPLIRGPSRSKEQPSLEMLPPHPSQLVELNSHQWLFCLRLRFSRSRMSRHVTPRTSGCTSTSVFQQVTEPSSTQESSLPQSLWESLQTRALQEDPSSSLTCKASAGTTQSRASSTPIQVDLKLYVPLTRSLPMDKSNA